MSLLHGMNIIANVFAVQRGFEVRPHPIRKKRRNWCVVRYERPGCYQVGDTFFMHPALIEKLKQATGGTHE